MGFRTSLGRAFSAATQAASQEWHESQLDRRITGDVIRYDATTPALLIAGAEL
jgi:hypothetical protein